MPNVLCVYAHGLGASPGVKSHKDGTPVLQTFEEMQVTQRLVFDPTRNMTIGDYWGLVATGLDCDRKLFPLIEPHTYLPPEAGVHAGELVCPEIENTKDKVVVIAHSAGNLYSPFVPCIAEVDLFVSVAAPWNGAIDDTSYQALYALCCIPLENGQDLTNCKSTYRVLTGDSFEPQQCEATYKMLAMNEWGDKQRDAVKERVLEHFNEEGKLVRIYAKNETYFPPESCVEGIDSLVKAVVLPGMHEPAPEYYQGATLTGVLNIQENVDYINQFVLELKSFSSVIAIAPIFFLSSFLFV